MKRRFLELSVLGAILVGCPREPTLGLELQQTAQGVTMKVLDCDTKRRFAVAALAVYANRAAVCGIRWKLGSSAPMISEWTYGLEPSGYTMSACTALRPGQLYQAHAGGRIYVARDFRVREDGAVEVLAPACRP